VKFTPAQGRVSVGARLAPGSVVIEVKDTGIGMSPEEVRVALSRFAQVDHGINRKFEGTGLGLPLAQALVELHGGQLNIVSAPQVGTTVQIVLPETRIVRRNAPAFERRSA
jgi:signal transduction histidine kinase